MTVPAGAGLAERATTVMARIREHTTVSALVDDRDALVTRRETLLELTTNLQAAAALLITFRERGIAVIAERSDVEAARRTLRELRAAYEADPASIVAPNRLASLRRAVERVTVNVYARVQQAWASYAWERIPPVDDDTLQVLGRLPQLRQQVEAIRGDLVALRRDAEILPSDAVAMDAFEARAERAERAWAAFDTEHLPPAVLRFLRDAGSSGGATLDAFTEEVRGWLVDYGLIGSFVIRAAGAASTRIA